MNRHKLKLYQDKINKLEFPFKLKEYNIKQSFDNKKKELKNQSKSISNNILKEYQKNKKSINHFSDYIDTITSKIFNNNLFPKEKDILNNLEINCNMIKEYQECKKRLFFEDKELLEEEFAELFKKEEKNQNKKLEIITKETLYYFNLFGKLNDEYLDTKKRFRNPMDKFEYFQLENRHLKNKIEILKNTNKKLKEIAEKERDIYINLLNMNNKEKDNKRINIENSKNIENSEKNEVSKNYNSDNDNERIKNNNKKNNYLKNKTILITSNYYDIFNCNYYKSNKDNQYLNINYLNTKFGINNNNNNCLTSKNKYNKKLDNHKILKLKHCFSSNKILNKKNLTIQTNFTLKTSNKSFSKSNSNARLFSANSSKSREMNEIFDINPKNDDNEEKIYIITIFNYLRDNIELNNNYALILKKKIADEIKNLIWVKDLINKSIRELRYDIDDINKNIDRNKKLNIDYNKLELKKKENEKCLFFCTYFHDNCLNGNNKIKYLLKDKTKK